MSLNPDCVFCDIIKDNSSASIVYKDELCTAFMDIQPVNAGHVLIMPNKHIELIVDLDDETASQMFVIANRINRAIRNSSIKCEGINYFLADGEAANQEVFHVHLHVFPRYKGDGFGLVFGEDYKNIPPREVLETTAEKIRKCL
jgi:histidine triad (HIT) family protein